MEAHARTLLAASVAGVLAVVGLASTSQAAHGGEGSGTAPCYGINKCKGTGDCGGKGRSCAGTNACAGQGYLELEQETCLKIKDGRLTADPA